MQKTWIRLEEIVQGVLMGRLVRSCRRMTRGTLNQSTSCLHRRSHDNVCTRETTAVQHPLPNRDLAATAQRVPATTSNHFRIHSKKISFCFLSPHIAPKRKQFPTPFLLICTSLSSTSLTLKQYHVLTLRRVQIHLDSMSYLLLVALHLFQASRKGKRDIKPTVFWRTFLTA